MRTVGVCRCIYQETVDTKDLIHQSERTISSKYDVVRPFKISGMKPVAQEDDEIRKK